MWPLSLSLSKHLALYSPFSLCGEMIQCPVRRWACSVSFDSNTSTKFSLLPPSFMERRLAITVDHSDPSIGFFSLSLLSLELAPFHLTAALQNFSVAYPNSQHHCSGTLKPLFSKISYLNTNIAIDTVNLTTKMATPGLTGGARTADAGQGVDAHHLREGGSAQVQDFIALLRMAHSLKLISSHLFLFNI